MIATAAANNIYVAIAPVWSHMARRTRLTAAQVGPYSEQVAQRYKDRANVIWLNGGSGRGHEKPDVWKVIGDTLLRHNSHQLVSFHPFGRTVTTAPAIGSVCRGSTRAPVRPPPPARWPRPALLNSIRRASLRLVTTGS